MLNNVSVSENCRGFSGRKIGLINGTLVLHYDYKSNLLGVYVVTSFRNSKKTNPDRWDDTAKYCSLINLDNGSISFEEPASRNTTERRILQHLTRTGGSYSDYPFSPSVRQDFEQRKMLHEGDYVRIFRTGDYKLQVKLDFEREVI